MKNKISYTLVASLLSAIFILNGCSSSSDINKTHGAISSSGGVYGTGPNNSIPYPQKDPVDITGVPGAKVKYEPYSRGGNKNYTVLGKSYKVWSDVKSYEEIGTASWYGPGFHGNKTSNGETYNQKGFSAAHKNLPLPSYLKVTNLNNAKSVIVRVNDRGPFHGNRIIDLSESAARYLDIVKKGTGKVKIELVKVSPDGTILNSSQSSYIAQNTVESSDENVLAPILQDKNINILSGGFYVQFFSTQSSDRASEISDRLRGLTSYPIVINKESGYYRLRTGPIVEEDLENAVEEMKNLGYNDSFVKKI